MIDDISKPVALSLEQIKTLASNLTPDSMMRHAILQVIAEHEQKVSIIEHQHDARVRQWD
jgi:hypothetical protein